MIADSPDARREFIAANTRLQHPPHTPELILHLADEVTPLWKLTEEALAQIGLPPPFWAFAWAGGQALARYILDNPEIVAGRRVLDFAAGSGIVGIAAMRAGAAETTCADIDVFSGEALGLNAAANGVACRYVGADLLEAPPPTVMAWLQAGRAGGATVLIGDPGRSYFPRSGLIKLAEYQVPTTRELEDFAVKRTAVWAVP